jgi:streptogramin lyase
MLNVRKIALSLLAFFMLTGKIAEFNPSNSSWMNTYQLPSGDAQPLFLAFDSQGRLWFPLPMANSIAMFNPSNNTYQKWAIPTGNAGPWGVAVDHNGKVWFDDAEQGIFGSFPDSGSGSFATYNTPTSNSHPHDGLNVDGQNRIWFDEEFANKLAEANQSGVPVPTPSPTQSVQPSPTSTSISSPTPTVTSSPGTTLAQDTFQRASQTYWGKASDSQTWEGDANNSNVLVVQLVI